MTLIKGIGVDIIEVSRIKDLMERKGDRLRGKVFTEAELRYGAEGNKDGNYERLAARFAAKEAVSKALGTGFRGIRWSEIEIVNDPVGRPGVELHGGARALALAVGVEEILLTLSHCREYAVAQAIAIGGDSIEGSNQRRDAGTGQKGHRRSRHPRRGIDGERGACGGQNDSEESGPVSGA